MEINEILKENNRRRELLFAGVDQITGKGVGGGRKLVVIPDHDIPEQWLTDEVIRLPDYQAVMEAGSIAALLGKRGKDRSFERLCFSQELNRQRMAHDPYFAFAKAFHIKNKITGKLVPFKLNYG